jgi:NADH:flavin oxidoreductase / NADH oxidase family
MCSPSSRDVQQQVGILALQRNETMNSKQQPKLFTPVQIGDLHLGHRVVLPPLMRMLAAEGAVPSDLMVEYYSQRASADGLLIAVIQRALSDAKEAITSATSSPQGASVLVDGGSRLSESEGHGFTCEEKFNEPD